MKTIKTVLLGPILILTLISCDNCEQKATEKFWQEQAKIDKLKTGMTFIKGSYDMKNYEGVKTFAEYYFEDYPTEYRLVSRMSNKDIESGNKNIIRLGEALLKSSEFDLQRMKKDFIRICK
jgi:hypothetical protein